MKRRKGEKKKPSKQKKSQPRTVQKQSCLHSSVPGAAVGRAQSGSNLFSDKGCSLHAHKEVSFFSYSVKKKKRQRIPHANKKPIHFEEEMQRSFQEQALLDISSGIYALCEMEPLVPEQRFQSWQKQARAALVRASGGILPGLLASNFEVLQDCLQNRICKVSKNRIGCLPTLNTFVAFYFSS